MPASSQLGTQLPERRLERTSFWPRFRPQRRHSCANLSWNRHTYTFLFCSVLFRGNESVDAIELESLTLPAASPIHLVGIDHLCVHPYWRSQLRLRHAGSQDCAFGARSRASISSAHLELNVTVAARFASVQRKARQSCGHAPSQHSSRAVQPRGR